MPDAIEAHEEADRLEIFIASGEVIRDPMSLPDLSPIIDPHAVPVLGIPFDTKSTTGEKVDCALCGRHRNHFKGFVVTFDDGRKGIIGRNCGETQLFDQGAWKEMAASSERRKRKALYEARSAPTIAAIGKLIPFLNRCSDEVSVIDYFLSEVAKELPELYAGMNEAARSEGEMSRFERRLIPFVGRDGTMREKEDTQRKVFARLPTVTPFEKGGLADAIAAIHRGLEMVRSKLDQDEVTLAQQSEAFQALRSLGRDFRELETAAERARGFFSDTFWDGVTKWGRADKYREGNYRLVRRSIRHSDKDHIFGEVRLPPEDAYALSAFTVVIDMWPRL